jgi:hypothetical protein
MLAITIDAYSGRDNPSRFLKDDEATKLIRELRRNREAWGTHDPAVPRLGFRGVTIEFMEDGLARSLGLPQEIHLATGNALNEEKAQEIAERLINGMVGEKGSRRERNDPIEFTQVLAQHLIGEMLLMSTGRPDLTVVDIPWSPGVRVPGIEYIWGHLTPSSPPDPGQRPHIHEDIRCPIEVREFDPDYWNDPAHVRLNNCYNYATNHRTGTRAQPGWASGIQLHTFDCNEVTNAALADGAKRRGECCKDEEKPRWLIALVHDPIKEDYHWYRLHAEGFWGHKPGRLRATNLDNSQRIVHNPEHCDRGGYNEFCGYFYAPRSIRVE